ncbi:MAG: DUF309 domain-containing protein [Bacillota bacterium]
MYPTAYRRFLALFGARRYYEGHDVLEEHWRVDRQDFYKGLIQFAVGLYHASRGNAKGAARLLERAQGYLEPYRPSYLGLDVEAAVERIAAARLAVVRGAPVPRMVLTLVDPNLTPLTEEVPE